MSAFVPWAVAGVALVWLTAGLRTDLGEIGTLLSWVSSGVFAAAAYGLFVLVARESVPAARLPTAFGVFALFALLGAQLGVSASLHATHPYPAPAADSLRLAFICSGAIGLLSAPWVVAAVRLFSRGYPTFRTFPAVLAGAAAVVAGEALWRLHCPFTSPGHLASSHFPPYPLVVLVLVVLFVRRSRERG